MATVNIKLSQTVVNKNNQMDIAAGGQPDTLGDAVAATLMNRADIGEATYWANSLSIRGDKFTFTYPDGIKKVLTGSYTPIDGQSGTGTATQSLVTIPRAATETINGVINFSYTYDPLEQLLVISDTGGTITSYNIDFLTADADLGKISAGFTGSVRYDADMNLLANSYMQTISLTAQKHLKSMTIGGLFNVSGNSVADIGNGTTPNVNGTLNSYNETYVDKSVIDVQALNKLANSSTEFDISMFADAANWAGADEFTVDLPKTLYENWIINSGNGADKLTLKGGGGRLFANTGDGDDYVILLDNAPIVDGGNGNDTLEIHFTGGLDMAGVTNFDNLVLGGKSAIHGTGNAGY